MSSIPQIPVPKIKAFNLKVRLDYFVHFIEYFILSIFFILWRLDKKSIFKLKTFLLYIVIGLSIAFLDEFHQIFIPGRAFNIIDFMLNGSGFIIGTFVMYGKKKVRG
jgi:VanZ family protein